MRRTYKRIINTTMIMGMIVVLLGSTTVSSFAAKSDIAYANDTLNITQRVTIQTDEEVKESREKEKAAKEVFNAIMGYKKKEVSKDKLDTLIKMYQEKYGIKSKNSTNSIFSTYSLDDIVNLNYTCYQQLNDYYCGPASAYIVLKGMGVNSNPVDGRTISQNNLANDLGTAGVAIRGTDFPGTWADMMDEWANTSLFVATWAPSYTLTEWKSNYFTYSYVAIATGGHGYINDTHMVAGGYHLEGYNPNAVYWHYVAGDGVDNSDTRRVHYEDPSYSSSYPTRYGPHWELSNNMAELTHDRGIVW